MNLEGLDGKGIPGSAYANMNIQKKREKKKEK